MFTPVITEIGSTVLELWLTSALPWFSSACERRVRGSDNSAVQVGGCGRLIDVPPADFVSEEDLSCVLGLL